MWEKSRSGTPIYSRIYYFSTVAAVLLASRLHIRPIYSYQTLSPHHYPSKQPRLSRTSKFYFSSFLPASRNNKQYLLPRNPSSACQHPPDSLSLSSSNYKTSILAPYKAMMGRPVPECSLLEKPLTRQKALGQGAPAELVLAGAG